MGKLERAWQNSPDLRLGQLLLNLSPVDEEGVWFVEDDEWEQAIDRWIKNGGPGGADT